MKVDVDVLGPYAWVQGRRATSKVTATSGGRLTNRYAWVPGRPTRRACLGVNLPLRVPPCKHYPEEVTEFKMAALILLRYRQRRLLRRNRLPEPNSPHGLCGRKATLNLNHISSQSSGAVSEHVWLSGKALGWKAEGPRFHTASTLLSLQKSCGLWAQSCDFIHYFLQKH